MELTDIIDKEIKKLRTEHKIDSDELYKLTQQYYSHIDNGYMEYGDINKIKLNICYDRDLCFNLGVGYNTFSDRNRQKINLFVLRVISKTPLKQLNKIRDYF